MEKQIKKSDFVQSLEKGLKVISAFDAQNSEMTLTEVAKKVDLTRANARRILLTLEYLGYMKTNDGKLFFPTAKILSLGYSYLSSLSFRELAQPFMQDLAKTVNESCSMSVIENKEIVYVARVHTKRIMTISLGIGTRLPIHATSMGKVLVAEMMETEKVELLNDLEYSELTPYTITNQTDFLKEIEGVKKKGWAVADQELELGVRSIACPVRDKNGNVIAALNISGHAGRVTMEEMKTKFLSALQLCVNKIETELSHL